MFNKLFSFIVTAFLLVIFSQSAFAQNMPSRPADADNAPLRLELLYVQVAPSATVTQQCNDKKQCDYQLTLNDISPYILTFNNGKPRVGGSMLTERFIKQYYFKSGKSSELNSALLAYENGKVQQHLVVVDNPIYKADKHQIIYHMQFMKNAKPIPSGTQLSNVALFIDSVCAVCIVP